MSTAKKILAVNDLRAGNGKEELGVVIPFPARGVRRLVNDMFRRAFNFGFFMLEEQIGEKPVEKSGSEWFFIS